MYFKKILVSIALIGIVVMAVFAYYVYSNLFIPNTAFNNKEAHIYIPTDATYEQVRVDLIPLLKDMETFDKVAAKKGYSSNIKSGHFIIKKGGNNNDIINSIRTGNVPIDIKFNNQERLENLAGHLSQQMEPDSISFLKAMRDSNFYSASGFNEDTALGMYVPNTYEVYWNTSPQAFRDKMLKAYKTFWSPSRKAKAKKLKMTPAQVMSLAAIVQKETAKEDERPRVAGVYLNRISKGMLLQADPTVIFAKKKNENNFNQVIKRVLYKDLVINSPYNTYQNVGVPPGPIAMPDVSSINAVLNAEQHNYLFFVADVTNFGYHKFAKNLAGHNRNKSDYVAWVNKNGVKR
jgi:UPF0755 protein